MFGYLYTARLPIIIRVCLKENQHLFFIGTVTADALI